MRCACNELIPSYHMWKLMSSNGAAGVKILQSAIHGNTILYCFPHWARRQTAIFHYAMKKGKEQALSPDFQVFVTSGKRRSCRFHRPKSHTLLTLTFSAAPRSTRTTFVPGFMSNALSSSSKSASSDSSQTCLA